jgi:hypothetical protein
VEWLDEICWKDTDTLQTLVSPSSGSSPPLLYPSFSSSSNVAMERMEVKLWQYWELCLAEEFWPLSRQQVGGSEKCVVVCCGRGGSVCSVL